MYESTQIQKICSNKDLIETIHQASFKSADILHTRNTSIQAKDLDSYVNEIRENFYNLTISNSSQEYNFNVDLALCIKSLDSNDYLRIITTICQKFNLMNEDLKYNSYRLFFVKYFYPFILIFGVLSNIISFFIMMKIYNDKKNLKFAFTLAILSLADLAVLIFGCLTEYMEDVLEFSLRSSSLYACKLIFYCCYMFSCFSAYMNAFIAFERYRAIVNPIKTNVLKSKRKKKTICFIFLFCLSISIPFIYFPNINDVLGTVNIGAQSYISFKEQCELHQNNFAFDLTQALIDSIFYQFVPLLIIIIFSTLSARDLIKNRSIFITNKDENKPNNSSKNSRQMRILSPINCQRASRTSILANSTNFKVSIMLTILPFSCFLTKCPIFVIILLKLENNFFEKENSKNIYTTEFEIAKTLMFLNYSVNILYYIVFGKNYRQKFFDIITNKRKFTYRCKAKDTCDETFL